MFNCTCFDYSVLSWSILVQYLRFRFFYIQPDFQFDKCLGLSVPGKINLGKGFGRTKLIKCNTFFFIYNCLETSHKIMQQIKPCYEIRCDKVMSITEFFWNVITIFRNFGKARILFRSVSFC